MAKKQDKPNEQDPKIPNPIPIGISEAKLALEILTDDEIEQAVSRGKAKWQATLEKWKKQQAEQQG